MHYKYLILCAIVNILYLVSRKQSVPKSLPNLITKLQQIPKTNFLPVENTEQSPSPIGQQNNDSSQEDTVMDLEYSGNWYQDTAFNSSSLFNYFTQDSGFGIFTGHLENSNSQTEDVILIEMFDGQYVDRRLAIVFINYTSANLPNGSNMTYIGTDTVFTYNLGYSDSLNSESNYCEGNYTLNFYDVTNNTPFDQAINSDNYENIGANISLTSNNCSFSFNATLAIVDTTNENMAMIYAIFATFICIIHVVACLALIKLISQNDYEGNHFSLITLGTFTCWDVFLCLFNLYIALSMSDYFHYFITPAFWYFILSAIFETRVMLLCWRTRYYSQFQNTTDFRRAISKFYFHLYGSLLLILFLGYFFLPDTWFLYLTAPYLVPQIVHNAIKGQKVKFNWQFVFLLGLLRVGVPCYVKSYSYSVFRYTPDPSFAIWYTSFVLFQILILFLQSKVGPRFFIPSIFLPPKFNYYFKLNLDEPGIEEENCSICLSSYLEENVISSKEPLLDKKTKNRTVKVMRTPCNHKYHEKCLKDWMEFKLECPFCRAKLPPL